MIAQDAAISSTGEERHRLYTLLRLRMGAMVERDVEVSSAIGDGFCITVDLKLEGGTSWLSERRFSVCGRDDHGHAARQ